MRPDLPSGTATFLFTDVEGSTRLLHELGAEVYAEALAEHRRIVRGSFARHGGVEVDTQGDAFFVAFSTADGALAAADEAQRALAEGPIRVRMGIHTGTPMLTAEGYVGADVHRAARICAAGHGGQVLVSATTASVLDSPRLRELGEHRLKDFDEPVPLYQLGEHEFPPLMTISNTNLPRPASSFVGREREVAEIGAQLRDGARLLTLTGAGGTGKTRLAIEAAAELVPQFKAGVFWIPLAPLRDAALVADTIAYTLGAKEGLDDHIGNREMLLLLDNLEQVVDVAPELARLVETCPNLTLLATSRERLRVRGEVEYPVPPLADADAIELFCHRARVRPDGVVADLCHALDNLPLALELAAARASVLSPRQILERLSRPLDLLKGGRDADPRQRTLRATIAWSYELLGADEQRLFAHLAVFRRGCTLEAAEAVAGADLDTLESLVDKSLVRHRADRFWMLETIREFAAERLEERGDLGTARGQHLAHFLELAERAYDESRTGATAGWFATLDSERDNVRAALDWASINRPDRALRLAAAVAPYWAWQGHEREAHERLMQALARYEPRDRVRARALTQLGKIDPRDPEARDRLDEALRLWRQAGDRLGEALALEATGDTYLYAGDYSPAKRAFEQSLAVRREAGAPPLEGVAALGGLCQLLVASGDVDRVEPMARELYELGSRYGYADAQMDGLHYLADCPLVAGDYAEAERRYRQSLAHARDSGFVSQSATELIGVAMAAAGQGEDARAVRLAAAAYAQRAALGLKPGNPAHWWIKLQEQHIGAARARLGPEQAAEAERAGETADFALILDGVVNAETADAS